jgi:phosphatidylinositol-3-phosphatase
VLIVVMENHSYEQVIGNSQMPYINSLARANAVVSTTDLSHPSLPNYLGLISGSIQNNPQDTTPQDGTYGGSQFTDLLAAKGIGWKAYMEDMPRACDLSDTYSPGNYDVNHNPFMYFNSVRNNPNQCKRDVPYPQLTTDLRSGTAPPFIWVSPNTIHDMHDGTDAQGDAFIKGLVTQVRGSSWWTSNSRLIVTWDEGAQSEQVATIVVGAPHGAKANGGNLYGTLRGLERAYGVGLLGGSANPGNGDIRPLLTGFTSPPASTPPKASPKPSPKPSPKASPSPSPSQSPLSSSTPSAASGPYVRGVYGKISSPAVLDAMAATGFNTAMVGAYKQELDPLVAKGLKGVVWLGAWFNSPRCAFEDDDAKVRALVSAIAGHPAILAYYLGDEPRVTECPNAPALFRQRSALVHSLDPGSQTFTVLQQFENGVSRDYAPWAGTVDIIGFDIYPCNKTRSACEFTAIDTAITAIAAAKITNYWAIVQDFQDCYYTLPTPQELRTQFDHWSQSQMSGYLVFSWNYQSSDNSCQGTSLDVHPDNLAELKYENSRTFSPPLPKAVATSSGVNPLVWAGVAGALVVVIVLTLLVRRRQSKPSV